MRGTKNHVTALTCCWFMRQDGYTPKTLLNVGVGKTSPELDIWLWLLPETRLLGIDPRWSPRGYWTKLKRVPQVTVAVGDGSRSGATYCGHCRSITCHDQSHADKFSQVTVTTLDRVVEEHACEPPFFIWMDIDGSEYEALAGATETLKQTGWLNVEFSDTRRGPEQCHNIRELLTSQGFRHHYKHLTTEDELWRRVS